MIEDESRDAFSEEQLKDLFSTFDDVSASEALKASALEMIIAMAPTTATSAQASATQASPTGAETTSPPPQATTPTGAEASIPSPQAPTTATEATPKVTAVRGGRSRIRGKWLKTSAVAASVILAVTGAFALASAVTNQGDFLAAFNQSFIANRSNQNTETASSNAADPSAAATRTTGTTETAGTTEATGAAEAAREGANSDKGASDASKIQAENELNTEQSGLSGDVLSDENMEATEVGAAAWEAGAAYGGQGEEGLGWSNGQPAEASLPASTPDPASGSSESSEDSSQKQAASKKPTKLASWAVVKEPTDEQKNTDESTSLELVDLRLPKEGECDDFDFRSLPPEYLTNLLARVDLPARGDSSNRGDLPVYDDFHHHVDLLTRVDLA